MRQSRTRGTRIAAAITGLASAGMLALAACTPPAAAGGAAPGGTSTDGTASTASTATTTSTSIPSPSTGWTLVEYSASSVGPDEGGPTPQKLGPVTLYLVSPSGHRYPIRGWPNPGIAPRLIGWSGDGARALFSAAASPAPGTSRYQQVVLATGAVSSFALPGVVTSVSYTRPKGLALLGITERGGSAPNQLIRYGLDGGEQRVLWTGPNLGAALETPDGTAVLTGGSHGLVKISNAGKLLLRLPVSGKNAARGCEPVRWWAAGTVLADCTTAKFTMGGLFLVPAGGGPATQLTPPRSSSGPDLGDTNAYQLSSGLYLQALGPCGVTFIARAQPDGSAKTVSVPGTSGTSNLMLTAVSGRLLVRAWTDCGGGTALLWFNPASNSIQWLIRPPAKVEGVLDAIPFGRIAG